jgi:DNA repair and recombination protein RAD52
MSTGYQANASPMPHINVEPSPPERLAEISALLIKKLGPEYLATRQGGGGSKFTYVEGWRALELANMIFGWDGKSLFLAIVDNSCLF